MNRSKASATTLCQKCLKRGHYSYECTSAQQDRPYVSRPSRTQQLLNPKLAPKSVTEQPPLPEKQVTQRSKDLTASKRRSVSPSSDSVSTISTTSSRSPSPGGKQVSAREARSRMILSSIQPQVSAPLTSSRRRSRSPMREEQYSRSARYSRDRSRSISRSGKRERTDGAAERYRSRSPYRPKQRRDADKTLGGAGGSRHDPAPVRKRSLSPYSKRVALSKGE